MTGETERRIREILRGLALARDLARRSGANPATLRAAADSLEAADRGLDPFLTGVARGYRIVAAEIEDRLIEGAWRGRSYAQQLPLRDPARLRRAAVEIASANPGDAFALGFALGYLIVADQIEGEERSDGT
jgi:hypothetical protein